ncbi:YggS family pyridoxal phosphate-dependent enzyme [Lysinibacillus macroides]|uniref:Pyridoxal phosphate homeostasis protein n=1 Tax=Lysinibacillus macroides TaxID=33935 RepID=A0A0N0CVN9_9BACI|nr:YggS family pyridoxal phosphate-dependent enzyme [Lysinibacillus macroides]KOY81897.1 alanine racemase [Lysinibacillus macroides]QPR68004.1 YggS family pyridoxal phosphate-dependent enzyme [Lysinibacillus macroides]
MNFLWIEDNLKFVREKINLTCQSARRNPKNVKLLLATKTVSADRIKQALDTGETLIGENKVQELQEKYSLFPNENIEWHFIGHLQTNKVKQVLKYVTCIHSVDRLKLGRVLHRELTKENRKLDILVQVNTSYEESKFGVAPEETLNLIEQLSELDTLNIKGLMTIGKLTTDDKETRECFRLLKSIQQQVIDQNYPGVEMDILSMGMSGDFEIAIEEGATLVRVGTAIFGEREYPDSYYWNEQLRMRD